MVDKRSIDYCEYLKTAHSLFQKAGVNKNHLSGLKIWIWASKHDFTSIMMETLYKCVLNQLGADILEQDYDLILKNKIEYDVVLIFNFTPGSSARAIEFLVTSKNKKNKAKDKLHVFMPKEYEKGYISRRLRDNIIAGKLIYQEKILFERFNKNIFQKCIANFANIVNDQKEEMELIFKPRIAIITALPTEFTMVKELLSDIRPDKSLQDEKVQYPHGRIGSNDVVVAMTGRGNNLSSSIATKLYEKYHSIEYTFLCGIAAGIPDFKNPAESVRLGDIVLSNEKGILQYDRIKSTEDGDKYDFTPKAPNATIFRNIQAYVEPINKREYKYWTYLDELLYKYKIVRPKEEVLDESPWVDTGHEDIEPILPKNKFSRPRLHFGPIASANTVVKKIAVRNRLKDDFKAKAIEMEASGVADAGWLVGKSCFIVRGICDYANPDKNDKWQDYAAAAAATFIREIIEETLSQ